jgi:hypothetical protein
VNRIFSKSLLLLQWILSTSLLRNLTSVFDLAEVVLFFYLPDSPLEAYTDWGDVALGTCAVFGFGLYF